MIDRTSDAPAPSVAVQETDDAVFVFSSGTTDRPKAVRHIHRSIDLGTQHWVTALGLGPEDRFQVATPPSHILGLLNLLAAAAAGATVRLHRRFDLDEELRCIQDERMTLEMAVAPIALAMANHPSLEDYDLSSLRYVMWGATPITPSVAELVSARTGVRWLPAYGTSEVPVITANPVDDPDRWRLDSAGLPVGGVTLRVVDLETGEVLPAGGVGEVQVLSDSAMAGYLPDEATAAAFADGWYRTGDVGWLEPEGWVHLTDRSKEMIKVSGFQVAPAEIEAVLHGHPDVIDCAVFGVPDQRAGEVPVAAVQLEAGSDVTAEDLERLVADALATYKRLHHVVLVDAIPRTPSGKVLRRTLRDEWAPALADRAAELMDVRLSPEQVALARRRGAGGRPPGRARRCRARRPGACREARRRRRPPRAGASCGRRPTTGHPGPRRSRSRSSPRSSAAAWPTPPSSVRPWPPSSADGPARRPPEHPRRWRCAPTSESWPPTRAAACPRVPSRSTPAPRPRRWWSSAAPTGWTIGAVVLDPPRVDQRRRPHAARRIACAAPGTVTAIDGQARQFDAATTWRPGRASAWP